MYLCVWEYQILYSPEYINVLINPFLIADLCVHPEFL